MRLTIKNRLMLGFGVMLLLLAVVAGVGQRQLAHIQHFNSELVQRAYRLSLASDWATQVSLLSASFASLSAIRRHPQVSLNR